MKKNQSNIIISKPQTSSGVSAMDCANWFIRKGDKVNVILNEKSRHVFSTHLWMNENTIFTYIGFCKMGNNMYNFETQDGRKIYLHHIDYVLINQ